MARTRWATLFVAFSIAAASMAWALRYHADALPAFLPCQADTFCLLWSQLPGWCGPDQRCHFISNPCLETGDCPVGVCVGASLAQPGTCCLATVETGCPEASQDPCPGAHCAGRCCPAGDACQNGVCRLSAGQACTAGDECSTGFCSDGVCCATDCPGSCHRCNQTGFEGTCRDRPDDSDCQSATPDPQDGSAPLCLNGSCAWTCPRGFAACDGACVDLGNDPRHCGGCQQACPLPGPGATVTCVGGQCGSNCGTGYASCGSGTAGTHCETNLIPDPGFETQPLVVFSDHGGYAHPGAYFVDACASSGCCDNGTCTDGADRATLSSTDAISGNHSLRLTTFGGSVFSWQVAGGQATCGSDLTVGASIRFDSALDAGPAYLCAVALYNDGTTIPAFCPDSPPAPCWGGNCVALDHVDPGRKVVQRKTLTVSLNPQASLKRFGFRVVANKDSGTSVDWTIDDVQVSLCPSTCATGLDPTPVAACTCVAPPDSIGTCTLFPPPDDTNRGTNSDWRRDVSAFDVDPDSAFYLAQMNAGPNDSTTIHPDFGSNCCDGIPWSQGAGSGAFVDMGFDVTDESDIAQYPFGLNPPIEAGGDRHVLVVDPDHCKLYEAYHCATSPTGWDCYSGAIFDLGSSVLRPDTWTSADAAGLPITAGLVKRSEVWGGDIDHALRFTVARTQRAFIHPATHYTGNCCDTDHPPMGLRVRLNRDYPIGGFSPHAQVILRAMKKYGMILADNGADWFVSGETNPGWNDAELAELRTVPANAFEVVKMGDGTAYGIHRDSGYAASYAPGSRAPGAVTCPAGAAAGQAGICHP